MHNVIFVLCFYLWSHTIFYDYLFKKSHRIYKVKVSSLNDKINFELNFISVFCVLYGFHMILTLIHFSLTQLLTMSLLIHFEKKVIFWTLSASLNSSWIHWWYEISSYSKWLCSWRFVCEFWYFFIQCHSSIWIIINLFLFQFDEQIFESNSPNYKITIQFRFIFHFE